MGNNKFQRFLQIASGSASELDCELLLAKDLGYRAKPDYAKIADELSQIRKMLSSLLRKVNVDRKGQMLNANCQVLVADSELRRFRKIKLPHRHRRHHHIKRFLSASAHRDAHRLDIR